MEITIIVKVFFFSILSKTYICQHRRLHKNGASLRVAHIAKLTKSKFSVGPHGKSN